MSALRHALALALLLSSSVVHADGVAPEGANLARLDLALAAATRARITTTRGVMVVSETRATPARLEYRNLLAWEGSDTLRSPGVVEWAEVRTIETQRGTRAGWLARRNLVLVGVVVGAGLGIVGSVAGGWLSAGQTSAYLFPPLGAAVGYGAGLLKERCDAHWRPVYP